MARPYVPSPAPLFPAGPGAPAGAVVPGTLADRGDDESLAGDDPILASPPSPATTPAPGRGGRRGAGRGGLPGAGRADLVPWLIALVTAVVYTTISVMRYRRLSVGSWDLGIYTEYVRQISRLHAPVVPIRSAGFNLLGDHFQPIVALLAPFFRLFPSPVTLLVAQALLTGVSVVPVCRAARARLGIGVSRAIGVAYGFSWGLQQMISFDFHEVAFAVPLLACSLSALVRRRPRAAVLWALPLVFVKEDQGLTAAAIGLMMLIPAARPALAGDPPIRARTWTRAGAILACWGVAWSVIAVTVIIPHFNLAHHYQYWHDAGVAGPDGHFSVTGLLGQFTHAGTEKLRTIAMLLLPTAFLALRSPLALIALPSLLLRMASTNSFFWGTDWHYNATLMPVFFLAAVDALTRLGERRARASEASRAMRRPGAEWNPRIGRGHRAARPSVIAQAGAGVMLAVAAGLAFLYPLSGLWHPSTYQISPHVRAENAALSRVPPGTTVEATLSLLAPLAARDDTSWIGTTGIPRPRYIVYDADDSGWNPPPPHTLRFLEQRHPGTAYQQVFRSSNVYVFRLTRAAPPAGR